MKNEVKVDNLPQEISSNGKQYLTEVLAEYGVMDLPVNCIFDKVLTGCGGTSVALWSKKKYIVACPSIQMIENKLDWCISNKIVAIGVIGGVSKDYIREAIRNGVTKIMATYDSLPKLVAALEESVSHTEEWNLLVDECHNMLKLAVCRPQATDAVENTYKLFKSYCFMSATPTSSTHSLDFMKSMYRYRVIWTNAATIKYSRVHVRGQFTTQMASILSQHLDGVFNNKGHVFINNVDAILGIVERLVHYNPTFKSHIRIVVGKGVNGSEAKVKRAGFTCSKIGDMGKLNFYTSTAFEGCDIYDATGFVYILTDGTKKYTLYDIESVIIQIFGRLRNHIYADRIKLYYTSSRYFGMDKSVFMLEQEKLRAISAGYLSAPNATTEITYRLLQPSLPSNPFLKAVKVYEDGIWKRGISLNEHALNYLESTFDTLHREGFVGRSQVSSELTVLDGDYLKIDGKIAHKKVTERYVPETTIISKVGGRDVTTHTYTLELDVTAPKKFLIGIRKSTRHLLKRACEISMTDMLLSDELEAEYREICSIFPDIKWYIDTIGSARIKVLEYSLKDVRDAVIAEDKFSSTFSKVHTMLKYNIGDRITLTKVLEDLRRVSSALHTGIEIKSATFLAHYFAVREVKIKGKDGKRVKGYEINTPLFQPYPNIEKSVNHHFN